MPSGLGASNVYHCVAEHHALYSMQDVGSDPPNTVLYDLKRKPGLIHSEPPPQYHVPANDYARGATQTRVKSIIA